MSAAFTLARLSETGRFPARWQPKWHTPRTPRDEGSSGTDIYTARIEADDVR